MNTTVRYQRNMQIIKEYNEGGQVTGIASKYGVSPPTIMNIIREGRETGLVTRPARVQSGDQEQRNSQIADAYSAGSSMAAIAKDFGLSRERVRQILSEIGVPSRCNSDYIRNSYDEWHEANCEEVNETFERVRTISGTIKALPHHRPGWVRRALAPRKFEIITLRSTDKNWSNEDLLGVLRAASNDGVLTIQRYSRWRDDGNDYMGRRPPTHTVIAWRYGSWNNALTEAGLSTASKTTTRVYTRTWSEQDAMDCVRSYVDQQLAHGVRPTFSGYETWAKGQPNSPSGTYLRVITGKPWAAILRDVMT